MRNYERYYKYWLRKIDKLHIDSFDSITKSFALLLRILASYKAKTAKISNLRTFWYRLIAPITMVY